MNRARPFAIRLAGAALALSLTSFIAASPVAAKGSSPAPSSHSSPAPSHSSPAPSKSSPAPSTGRSTAPPSNTGGSGSSGSTKTAPAPSTGRATTPPANTGGSGSTSSGGSTSKTPSTPKATNPSTQGSTRPTPGTRSTTATNPTTGTVYVYHSPSFYSTPYYHSYLGFYPPLGTSDYTSLIGNPLYYPNYITQGTCCYGAPWPAGYKVHNNAFVPISSSSHLGTILVVLFVLALLAISIVGALYFMKRRRSSTEDEPGSYASSF